MKCLGILITVLVHLFCGAVTATTYTRQTPYSGNNYYYPEPYTRQVNYPNYPVDYTDTNSYYNYASGYEYNTNGYNNHYEPYQNLREPYQSQYPHANTYTNPWTGVGVGAPYPYKQQPVSELYYDNLKSRKHDRSLLENLNSFPTITKPQHAQINCPGGQIDSRGNCRMMY